MKGRSYSGSPSFFNSEQTISLKINDSYLKFEIPTAEDLYFELILKNKHVVISKLTLDQIEAFLKEQGCDMALLEEGYREFTLPGERHYYVFSFKHSDNLSKEDFAKREQFFNVFFNLRFDKNVHSTDDLFLDSSEAIKLHLSSRESYTFAAPNKRSDLPVSYRADCLYELFIRELYETFLERIDMRNYLISDYLRVHTNEFTFFNNAEETNEYLISLRLINCIKNIACDRNAALLMEDALNNAQAKGSFPRGILGILTTLPLSASAILQTDPKTQTYIEKLNQYSYHYCSLIQYRYLLDLKSIFANSKELQLERAVVKNEMVRWEKFRTQPLIQMTEKLIEKISELSKQMDKPLLLSWDLNSAEKNEVVCIYPLPTSQGINSLDEKSSRAIADLFVSETGLELDRTNHYEPGEPGFDNGYFFFIRKDELVKFSEQLDFIPSKKRRTEQTVQLRPEVAEDVLNDEMRPEELYVYRL